MEILEYLAELIQHRKQVGIAGLGTVYKSKVPGRYDAEAHAFLPPGYNLHFSTELLENEALAEYISFKRNISVDSAHYFIEQFSDKAVQELSEKNETQLGSLGKLSSVDGSIVFEPAADVFSGSEYFGLPKVNEEELTGLQHSEPLIIEQVEDDFVEDMSDEEDHISAEQDDLPGEIPALPTEAEEQPEKTEDDHAEDIVPEADTPAAEPELQSEELNRIEEENKAEEENPGTENHELAALLPTEIRYTIGNDSPENVAVENKNPFYVKIIFAVIFILFIGALAYFLYPKMMAANREEIEESQSLDSLAYLAEIRAADSAAYADSIRLATIMADSLQTDSGASAAEAAKSVPAAEKPAVTTYEIVIGSLANMKEANKFIAQIKRKGINGWVVDSLTTGKIRVSIASFTDREAATIERRKIVKNLKDPSIYIYTNKPKK